MPRTNGFIKDSNACNFAVVTCEILNPRGRGRRTVRGWLSAAASMGFRPREKESKAEITLRDNVIRSRFVYTLTF